MDVQRCLAGEAVIATNSAPYSVAKFVRRNRVAVTTGAVLFAALLIGVVAFAWQAMVARDRAVVLIESAAEELGDPSPVKLVTRPQH